MKTASPLSPLQNSVARSVVTCDTVDTSRRRVLKTGLGVSAAAAGSLFSIPTIGAERSLKIGTYGGYFEDSFKKHVYPAFTKATGIKVESVTTPNSADWLVTMQQATAAGNVPADLSLYTRDTTIKASRLGKLLAPLDSRAISTLGNLDERYIFEAEEGLQGVGAMGWFTSMVYNPDQVDAPKSWADFWDSSLYEASLGMSRTFNNNLLDIVAATFFDGVETLNDREGIRMVMDKIHELRPNVALWWAAESQMEQGMKNEDVIAGMYYHDVAGLMAADGFPIASIFPKEGNPQVYGSWSLSPLSEKSAEALEFLAFSCDSATQSLMSRQIGTAPLIPRSKSDLSDEEFAAVSGSPVITPAYESYVNNETFITDTWEKMLAS